MMIAESIRMAQRHANLNRQEARYVMLSILEGKWTFPQIAAWLSAMATKGETVLELLGCHDALMGKSVPVDCGVVGSDVWGLVGDSGGTFDAATAAALLASAAGMAVAKIGSQSSSSRCHSADLLEAVGVRTDVEQSQVPAWLDEARFVFLATQAYHPSLSKLALLRQQLGTPTLLDLLWPLCHPARPRQHIIGAATREFWPTYVEVLQELGISQAILIHGRDGLGHLSPNAPTDVCEITGPKVRRYVVDPARLGWRQQGLHDLQNDWPANNGAVLRGILRGVREPLRDLCLLHTAPALLISGRVSSLREGVDAAADLIDFGPAAEKLDQLVARSCRPRRMAG